MLSLNVLLAILLSVFFPTMFSTSTLDADTLTLRLPTEKARATYSATLDAGGMVKAKGIMTMDGVAREATANFQKAVLEAPETRAVTFPLQRFQLDEKFRPTSPDFESPCIDLFAILGTDKIVLIKDKATKFDFTWRKNRIRGTVMFKGVVNGKIVVETNGTVTVDKTKFALASVLHYAPTGGAPTDLSAQLVDKRRTIKWEFAELEASTSDKGKI